MSNVFLCCWMLRVRVRVCKISISSSLCGEWDCLCVIFAVLVLFYGRFYSTIVLLFMVMCRFSIAKKKRTHTWDSFGRLPAAGMGICKHLYYCRFDMVNAEHAANTKETPVRSKFLTRNHIEWKWTWSVCYAFHFGIDGKLLCNANTSATFDVMMTTGCTRFHIDDEEFRFFSNLSIDVNVLRMIIMNVSAKATTSSSRFTKLSHGFPHTYRFGHPTIFKRTSPSLERR